MQSAEMVSKSIIWFRFLKKFKRHLLLPPLQGKNNCLAPSPLWRKKSASCTLHMRAFTTNNELEKGNEHAIV